jgi:hypothetical protein
MMRTTDHHTLSRVLGRKTDDQGSMLIALMGILIVTVAVTATMAMIYSVQRTTRHDNRFVDAGQGSDAGVQQAYFMVNSLPKTSTATQVGPTTATIGGVTYTYTATRATAKSLEWTVTSTASKTAGQTTTRTVTAKVAQTPLFTLAAFADSSMNFNGNNSAVSYPVTGQGNVGTNGTLNLQGNSTHVDGLTLYDWQNNPDLARCSGQGCPAQSSTSTINAPLNTAQAAGSTGFIQAQIDACKQAGPLTAFVGETIAAKADGSPYCFSSFWAKSTNFTVTGAATDPPVRIFVDGGDVVLGDSNHSDVNNDVSGSPSSIRLQIYTTGTTVSMYNQSNLAAAVYAPNASCGGVTSNAGSDFYGSMICKVIDNVGGWTFHYDTRLASIGDGAYRISQYTEK